MISRPYYPTAELKIDLGAIQSNYKLLKSKLNGAECAAVVKANGYGLGAVDVSRTLEAAGCEHFYVAHIDEALEIKPHLKGCIYVFHGNCANSSSEFVASGLVPVINDFGQLEQYAALADNNKLPAVIHVDTGMNRLGFSPHDIERLLASPNLERLDVLQVMSHLAVADEPDHPLNQSQFKAFSDIRKYFKSAKASLANSSGVFLGPDYHFDIARPGVALYGVNPTPQKTNPMRHVIELTAEVIQLREVKNNGSVGYGASRSVKPGERLAVLGIGYADGYPWLLGNKYQVDIAGYKAPIAGRVTMDLLTVDVTHIPPHLVQPGAKALLVGAGDLDVDNLARSYGSIGYEFLTRLGNRFARTLVQPAL